MSVMRLFILGLVLFGLALGQSCNQRMMESFGFEGQQQETLETLTMCPDVSLSCCTQKDQMVMYNRYVISG